MLVEQIIEVVECWLESNNIDYDPTDINGLVYVLSKADTTAHNSDKTICQHDFIPRKTWVHTCTKCGLIEIEKGHIV